MIKFFRKIRQKLLEQNRVSKYLLYAFGEIILVVIGILIALQINNWNEKKSNAEKINNVFEEIKKDLLNDIEEATLIADFWEKKALKIKKILKNKTSKDSLILFDVGIEQAPFKQSNLSFLELNSLKDKLPRKYSDILKKLNRLYLETSNFVEKNQKNFSSLAENYRDELYKKYDWAPLLQDFDSLKSKDELKTYFTTNKAHFRHLALYDRLGSDYYTSLADLKEQSVLCYLILNNLISPNSKVPELLSSYKTYFKLNDITEIEGRYFSEEFSSYMYLTKKYNMLFMEIENSNEIYTDGHLVVEIAKDSLGFVGTNIFPFKMTRDQNKKINGFIGYIMVNDKKVHFKKQAND